MLAWSRIECEINYPINSLSITDKGAARPGAHTDGPKLSKEINQLTVAINIVTDHLTDGQIMSVVKADTQKCAAWNLTMLDRKEKDLIFVNIKGVHHIQSMLLVYEKRHLNQNTLLLMRTWHPPCMQPGC